MHSAHWIARLLQPIRTAIGGLISRGVIKLVDDARKGQELQVRAYAGQLYDPAERFGEAGFSSRPEVGAECVVLCPGGSRAHAIVIATEDRRVRPKNLAAGETVLYASSGGSVVAKIHIKANGDVEVTAGKVTVTGDVEAGGDVKDLVGTMAAIRTAYNAHTHTDPQGGATGPPTPQM